MSSTIVNIEGIGEVTFAQSRKSKHLKLSVNTDSKVRISFPPGVSPRKALGFVEKNRDWIAAQQKKHREKQKKALPLFPLKTRFHTIYLECGTDKFTAKNIKLEIYIYHPCNVLPEDLRTVNFVRKVLDEVYRWEARNYLPERISKLAQLNGFRYNKLTIRNNASNWGSCSSQNNISLNLQLMKLPKHLSDYVILHELVHTLEKNHGPAFWRRLNEATGGDARKLAAEMKKYSTSM
ncbi:MAG: M48 family metallopeptidase [Prolixibacteraceae bacterium]|nr:M48 family metallopeptidase [Prolixibacteraceae bacterium]